MNGIEIVKILSEVERDTLAPHVEAMRRAERVIAGMAPAPGLKFDRDALCYYREAPPKETGE